MLHELTIENLEEYKRNACKILQLNVQYDISAITEELYIEEINRRKILNDLCDGRKK